MKPSGRRGMSECKIANLNELRRCHFLLVLFFEFFSGQSISFVLNYVYHVRDLTKIPDKPLIHVSFIDSSVFTFDRGNFVSRCIALWFRIR